MKIGNLKLDIKRPANLDEALLEIVGVTAAEMAAMLARPCIAGTVAAALLPFTPQAPARHALAEAIEKAGVDGVRADVADLYAKHLTTEAAGGEKQE